MAELAYCSVPNLGCLNPAKAEDQNGYPIGPEKPRLRWRCRWCDKAACRNHRSKDLCLDCLDIGGPAGLGICVAYGCPKWAIMSSPSEDCPGNLVCKEHRSQ